MIPPISVEIQVKFLRSFEWDCIGVNHSFVVCLAWTEWRGLQFYSPLWFHPFGWKHRGIAGGSQCACHKITGKCLIGALSGIAVGKTVCPTGMGGKLKKNLQLYCTCIASWNEMIEREPWRLFKLIFWLEKMCHRISGVMETEFCCVWCMWSELYESFSWT